ncbi:unnamed protein product [Rhodiola kirilowii]
MVHLLVHLPDQILLKGPIHYSWMYLIERQLGEYKRHVRNTRYPEGCIAEQYIVQECVTYYKLYTDNHVSEDARPQPTPYMLFLIISSRYVTYGEKTHYETNISCPLGSDDSIRTIKILS